ITFLLVNYIMSMLMKRVTEIMSEGPVDVVEKGLNVFYAANVMKERARGSLVVVDDGKPVGIVTERDIVRRVVAEGRSPSATKVGDIMSAPLISVGPEATVAAAVRVMYENGIRRLPVVENDRVVGMLTVTDLARAMYREREKKDEILAAMARFKELEELAKR
ncbi:MAG: CBS domain-containing protein, partial [Candidatus Nitrosocaldus sp.]